MKVCFKPTKDKAQLPLPKLVNGHLYKNHEDDIYLYCLFVRTLVHVETGLSWDANHDFGTRQQHHYWIDVTDKYCLQEI